MSSCFDTTAAKTPMAAFQTLLGLGTQHAPTPYAHIRRARDLDKTR